MEGSSGNLLQFVAPLLVMSLLVIACFQFYNKYVQVSKELAINLRKLANTVRTMTDGEESVRKNGVARVFMNTPLENIWKDFAKTLHVQTSIQDGVLKQQRSRMTVPANHFFSVSAVIDRPLSVEYFKHLPGILTGIGIIGTFAGLLFGLSNFDASNAESMQNSISLLISGVRDAFYASAAAITAAMVITHWEKSLYNKCLTSLDELVEAVNSSFEAGIGEEYLATLVKYSSTTSEQSRTMKDEFIQAFVPILKQLESLQNQQSSNLTSSLEQVLSDSNRRLASHLETAMIRQIKTPIEEFCKKIDGRVQSQQNAISPDTLAKKVIKARLAENAENSSEAM